MRISILRRPAVAALTLTLLIHSLVIAGNRISGNSRAGHTAQSKPWRPKLVVLIVLDQFRADYITRFEPLFGPNGFKRLLNRGAYLTNANYPYANTFTAVGHSSIVSGSIPSIHG